MFKSELNSLWRASCYTFTTAQRSLPILFDILRYGAVGGHMPQREESQGAKVTCVVLRDGGM